MRMMDTPDQPPTGGFGPRRRMRPFRAAGEPGFTGAGGTVGRPPTLTRQFEDQMRSTRGPVGGGRMEIPDDLIGNAGALPMMRPPAFMRGEPGGRPDMEARRQSMESQMRGRGGPPEPETAQETLAEGGVEEPGEPGGIPPLKEGLGGTAASFEEFLRRRGR